MNIFVVWPDGDINGKISIFAKVFHAKKCVYIGDSDSKQYDSYDCEFTKLPLYKNGIDISNEYIKSLIQEVDPIDADIVEKMLPFEPMMMEILCRGRRTYGKKGNFISIKSDYYLYLRFCYNIITKNSIDLYIHYDIPHNPTAFMCYAICKILGIPTIIRVPFTNPLNMHSLLNYTLAMSLEDFGCNFKHEYFVHKQETDFVLKKKIPINLQSYLPKFNEVDLPQFVVLDISANSRRLVFKRYLKRFYLFIRNKGIIETLKRCLRQVLFTTESRGLLKTIERLEVRPNEEERYYYFPLHYQPEATTTPMAGMYADQLLIIDLMSKTIPQGTFLYVKEHPAYWNKKDYSEGMLEYRSSDFYKTIKAYPNVRLISHQENQKELIKNSLGIITCSGTVGLEATIDSKPVFLFGHAFYQYFDNVFIIKTRGDIEKALERIQNNQVIISQHDLLAYFATLSEFVVVSPETADDSLLKTELKMMQIDDLDHYIVKSYLDYYKKIK